MASNTANLGLYKKDPATDGQDYFDIKTMMNDNWDIIDNDLGSKSHTHTNKTVLDNLSQDGSGNLLYNGKKISSEQLNELYKHVAKLEINQAVSDRLEDGVTIGDLIDGNPLGLQADLTSTKATEALNAGETVLVGVDGNGDQFSRVTNASDATKFTVGQKVDVLDDVNREEVEITRAETINEQFYLEVSALANSYKKDADITRTSANYDTTNNRIEVGSWGTTTTVTATDETVVSSAYETSASARPLKLDNGDLISIAIDKATTDNPIRIYKGVEQSDGSRAWSQLCYIQGNTGYNFRNVSLTKNSNTLHVLADMDNGSNFYLLSYAIDSTSVSNTNIHSTHFVEIETQSAFDSVNLTIDENGVLYGTASTKNGTYPNSFNARYYTSSDGGSTWSATQVTTHNDSLYNSYGVKIFLVNGTPKIAIRQENNNRIYLVDTDNTHYEVYNGGSYTQANPDPIFIPSTYSKSGNDEIHVSFQGKDGTDSTYENIRHAVSYDLGANWTVTKVTSGNTRPKVRPSITADKNGKVFIVFDGKIDPDNYFNIMKVENDGNGWSSIVKITSNSSNNAIYASTLFDPTFTLDFSEPLFIYQDNEAIKVGFYGTWTTGTSVPLLESNLRYVLDEQTDSVISWFKRNKLETTLSGTVEVASTDLKTVLGTSTLFTTELSVGDWIQIGGEYREVASIASDTSLTVVNAFDSSKASGSTITKQTFVINAFLNGTEMSRTTNADGTEDEFQGGLSSVGNAEVKVNLSRASTTDDVAITRVLGGIS